MNCSRASARAVVVSTLLALSASLLPTTGAAAEPSPSTSENSRAQSRLEPVPAVASTIGTDHWVTFPRLYDNSGQRKLYVTTAGPAATVTVTAADGTQVATVSVAPDAVAEVNVPASYMLDQTDGVNARGLHVTSTEPVSVYLGYLQSAASAGAIALPTGALGTSYRVLSYKGLGTAPSTASELAVVGTQAGTTVTITPQTSFGSRQAGVPYTVTLQRGETYQVSATSGSMDVTGTTVTADKPVAVMGASGCSNVPVGTAACNPLMQQMPPTAAWGTEFISGRLATRTKGDTYRVLADQAGTVVSVNGTAVATLAAGAHWEGVLPAGVTTAGKQGVVISTSKPALVAQYANGGGYDGTSSDPMMLLVPPLGQQLTAYKVATPVVTVNGTQMVPYVNVIAQRRDVGSLTLDGTAVAASEFVDVPGTDYAVAQLRVQPGQHVLRAVHQFGVQVYEWGAYDGIGFSGGYALAPIADAPPAPETSPLTSTGVGTESQTATVPVGEQQEVVLLDGTSTTDTVTVEDEGTYTLDPETAVITFAPELGFWGDATPVTFRVRDAYNQQSDNTYTPTVTKPAAPSAPEALTSRGHGARTVTVLLPEGGSVVLVGTTDVEGQGSYAVSAPGEITFTPAEGFDGEATPVTFEVRDAYGQGAESTFTPTVVPPEPTPADRTSSGVGTAGQSITVTVPRDGSLTLLDGREAATSVTVPQGTYTLDGLDIDFAPVLGFTGPATAVTFRVTDSYDQSGTATWTPSVVAPEPPASGPLTSTGVGTELQTATVAVPDDTTVALVGTPDDVTTVVEEGVGRYDIDPATGVITFAPALGFTGEAPVAYVLTDAYGQRSTELYTPTVTSPGGPTAKPLTSSGTGVQSVVVTAPDGGRVALVAADGTETTEVKTAGGTYLLDGSTGTISFAPAAGVTGAVAPVTYRVIDAYEQYAESTYTPTVTAVPATTPSATPPQAPLPAPDASARLRAKRLVVVAKGARARVATTCRVVDGSASGCAVKLWSKVSGKRTLVGRGTASGSGSTVKVRSRLNAVGRSLAARPSGVAVLATSTVRTQDGQTLAARAKTRVVARSFTLARAVYFRPGGASLVQGDRGYLRELGHRLGPVRSVTCTGFTDSRGREGTNKALGLRRARAACAALDLPRRVVVRLVSAGERRPVADNGTADGRARNRRATVTLTY